MTLPTYSPMPHIWTMMVKQRIASVDEHPQHLLERVVATFFDIEEKFGTPPEQIDQMKQQFAEYMVEHYVMPGTPALTNAGKNHSSALSSCVVVPVDLRKRKKARSVITSYYKQNMGSGFDLTAYDDPTGLLNWINDLSVKETATGKYDRYIGNMGSLHVSHPHIEKFIDAKKKDGVIKHFNISVDLSEEFMQAVQNRESFTLSNGLRIDAYTLFRMMAENAWRTGDPGVLFLERMNEDNPVATLKHGKYVSVPPCAEMGLAEGEACQFGYINLAAFVVNNQIDYDKLSRVTKLTLRALDNAVEYSLEYFPTGVTKEITKLKRKVGLGICGLADMLIACGEAYTSGAGVELARDVVSFINYVSKLESVQLAQQRGSCLAMDAKQDNAYFTGFLAKKYSFSTRTVAASQWQTLSDQIRQTGVLRNILTTALPPTGRASIILGVTSSLEPIFTIFAEDGEIKKVIQDYVHKVAPRYAARILKEAAMKGSFQGIRALPKRAQEVLRTAKEIGYSKHIQMTGALAGSRGVVDEAASKTVNLPSTATVEDVEKIFLQAYDMGLKNISVYRDQTKAGQPEKL